MNNPEDEITLNYSFTKREIGLLAKFLRQKETEIPHGLENFAKTIENSVYDCMTLEEVKKFYS